MILNNLGSGIIKIKKDDYDEFLHIINPIITHEKYQKLKNFRQHGKISIYDHNLNVAIRCFLKGKKRNLDYVSMTKGALLHDFYWYDWRNPNKGVRWHGFRHPRISLNNAKEVFGVNKIESNIILSHMFPLTIFTLPKSKESWIVCLTDKVCAIKETFKGPLKVEVI